MLFTNLDVHAKARRSLQDDEKTRGTFTEGATLIVDAKRRALTLNAPRRC
jgi:hypothetical protein